MTFFGGFSEEHIPTFEEGVVECESCRKCPGRLIKDLNILCISCKHFRGIYKPYHMSDEWGVHVVCDDVVRLGAITRDSIMLNCFSFEPIVSEDNCNGDCEHCESHTEWKEWVV